MNAAISTHTELFEIRCLLSGNSNQLFITADHPELVKFKHGYVKRVDNHIITVRFTNIALNSIRITQSSSSGKPATPKLVVTLSTIVGRKIGKDVSYANKMKAKLINVGESEVEVQIFLDNIADVIISAGSEYIRQSRVGCQTENYYVPISQRESARIAYKKNVEGQNAITENIQLKKEIEQLNVALAHAKKVEPKAKPAIVRGVDRTVYGILIEKKATPMLEYDGTIYKLEE